MKELDSQSRRRFIQQLLLLSAGSALPSPGWSKSHSPVISKPIPATGQRLPVIGMGTWITFNVGNDRQARLQRTQVLKTFFDMGGQIVDSSPMYGSAEEVLGFCIEQLGAGAEPLFSATKVWTSAGDDGPAEIEASRPLWGVDRFDLLQVHNLLAWERHLETLFEMKANGRVRYVGITTSHGRRHADLLRVMRGWPIDFVQATYNIRDREAEREILPLAAERGIADGDRVILRSPRGSVALRALVTRDIVRGAVDHETAQAWFGRSRSRQRNPWERSGSLHSRARLCLCSTAVSANRL